MSFPDNEPAITAGSLTGLVAAGLAVVVAFGFPLTPEQREAILGLGAVVAPIAVALLVRPHVTPTVTVQDKVDTEVAKAVAGTVSAAPP